MAFTASKKTASDFNGGNRYQNGNGLSADTINNLVEGLLYAQENGGGGSTPSGDYEVVSNKTTSLSSASTNTQYPSALAVVNFVQTVLGGSIDEIDRLIGG